MKDKITAFVKQNKLFSENDIVVIAFSGGADSVFLANYLLSIKDEFNLTLKIAHIEHGIRGSESLRDCAFSKKYANDNNIEFFEFHINAPEESKAAGFGLEEYSRMKRYEFFDTLQCDKIATAHNLTDNIETMLFRIARGTSLHGLCSIPVKRDNIVRPLLCVSGKEIRNYLKQNKISYCIDSTNSENDYSRNYIRNIIIPEFRNINSEFIANASRLIENINETEEAMNTVVNSVYLNTIAHNKLLIRILNQHPTAVIKRILYKYFNDNGVTLDSKHLNEIYGLLYKTGKIQLKGNSFAFSDGEFIRFGKFEKSDFEKLIIKKTIINTSSEQDFLNNCELYCKKFAFCCDYDKIVGNVFVRPRMQGDKISPADRGCTKTLKKLYNEYRIPVEKRNMVPVICDDAGIIGVYGYCVDERVKVNSSAENILVIDIHMDMEDKN